MTESKCKKCGIKILDTGWRAEKIYDLCTECELKKTAETISEDVREVLSRSFIGESLPVTILNREDT